MQVPAKPAFRCAQVKKRGKGVQTPGKSKGETCKTDPKKRFFACGAKAYLHPQYPTWHALFKRLNGAKPS